jgi:hypothetical protein
MFLQASGYPWCMGILLHSESLAAPAVSASAEPAPQADGAGIIHGVILGAAIWLIGLALAFLLMW